MSLVDIFPTVLESAGIQPSFPCDAHSLLPFLTRDTWRRPAPVVTSWGRGNHSLRVEQWRYTRYADGKEELYDHTTDPYEWTNLAGNTAFTNVCDRLGKLVPGDAN